MPRHTDAWGYCLFQSESFGSSAFTPGPFNWDFVVDSSQKLLNHFGSSARLVLDHVCVCKPLSLIVQTVTSSGRSTEKQNKNWGTCWGSLPGLHKYAEMPISILPVQVHVCFDQSQIEYIFCLTDSLY